ncbi:Aspartic protease [Phytophthora megakarya]|uniref:Aspartic protease n=1 Tax=Phytophthora megakarya TaxID=4795 RepID=A0A225V703_9STRA|nr:Aspartic protease [Phytophthora megakarya]
MYGYTIRRREYRDIPVCPLRELHLRPGEHANVVIRYGQCHPLQDVVWAGRGDQWVIQIVYGARSDKSGQRFGPRLLNRAYDTRCTDCGVWEYPHSWTVRTSWVTKVHGMAKQIIQENTLSAKARARQEAYEQMLRDAAPPAVVVPKYKWPTKLLVRTREPERGQVTKIVEKLLPQRDTDGVESAEDATLGTYSPNVIGSLMAVEVPPELATLDVDTQDGGEVVNSGSCGEVPDEMPQRSECDAFQDDPSAEDEDFGLPSSAAPGTPLARLDAAYARCMRMSAEELDL